MDDQNSEKIAGVDEVGRGPLVGDVVAAAVILRPESPIQGLADSKKLSQKKRTQLADQIRSEAIWAIGIATPEEIDELNILNASLLAMKRAVESLSIKPDRVLVDGNRCPNLSLPCEAIVKGDSKIEAISAASILAKVYRDAQMEELDRQYPDYGFARHKGYPTPEHLSLITKLGIISPYRKSFAPVKRLVKEC